MDPFIRVYPDMIEPALCRSIIERFHGDARRHPGELGGYATRGAKRSIDLEIKIHPEWQDVCRALDAPVARSLRRYREDVPNFGETQGGLLRETIYQVQCYQPNGQDGFAWHADVGNRTSSERVLAMIAYLNSVDEGGETEFRAQGVKVAPREGSIVWFPPTFPYVHRGKTPLSGPKYVITSFLVYPK